MVHYHDHKSLPLILSWVKWIGFTPSLNKFQFVIIIIIIEVYEYWISHLCNFSSHPKLHPSQVQIFSWEKFLHEVQLIFKLYSMSPVPSFVDIWTEMFDLYFAMPWSLQSLTDVWSGYPTKKLPLHVRRDVITQHRYQTSNKTWKIIAPKWFTVR